MKLKLDNISKTYRNGETVTALQNISIGFRSQEFVSILGPSGCGKTTLLNIIGGLDRHDQGDLFINGISTKNYKSSDWDAYRNRSIGFVFQSYNLIGHQTVLQNVEIALTLSGISSVERKRRAKQALIDVGLGDQLKKKPNQLSGGQMQRVAIARALVNDPDIILADEPTGALDSHTSVQIMEILKNVAKTRLVIMVTHNSDLAEEYSTRIIRLLDGEILSDSHPVSIHPEESVLKNSAEKFRKTSMTFLTATALSFRNLMTKRGRTLITAFAGSIGIIGVALVLALSNGLSLYMGEMQSDTLSGFPITVSTGEQTLDLTQRPGLSVQSAVSFEEFPESDVLYAYDPEKNTTTHENRITQDYLTYIDNLETTLPDTVNNISYTYGVQVNLLAKGEDTVVKYSTTADRSGNDLASAMNGNAYWQELPDNPDFILSLYDLIGEGSRLPESAEEVVLVVDEYNRIETSFFEKLGMTKDFSEYRLTDFIGKTMLKVIPNNDFYTASGELYTEATPGEYDALYESKGTALTIVGILRLKADASSSYLSEGLAYTSALTRAVVKDAQSSEIALAQKESDQNVLLGTPFKDETAKEAALLTLGAEVVPTGIHIYPQDYEKKDQIVTYLKEYNEGKPQEEQLMYSDMAESITEMTGTLLSTVTYVLIGFAAISLVVSTIMIAIITYVSVIERTKEIGILRSVGARKKDISRVFNAETLIIGLAAGLMGVGTTYLLAVPINGLISSLVGISGIANLNPLHALVLILGSMVLTIIAGFIPSRMAAGKDPVEALRTE